MSPEREATITAMSRDGATLDTIASATGLSRRTIERARRELGLTNATALAGARLTAPRRAQLAQLIADRTSHAEIIRTMRISGATIRRHHPGTAWDPVTAGEHGQAQRRLNQIGAHR